MSAEATGDYFGNISGDAMRVLIQIVALQHPSRPRWLRCWPRLPRPRGDAPRSVPLQPTRAEAPPPTRGCTRGAVGLDLLVAGSPAHAGMHPTRAGHERGRTRLPRPRGDAPAQVGGIDLIGKAPPPTRGCTPDAPKLSNVEQAPPPTRGCTHRQPRPGSWLGGSPAHAGMHPPRRRACRWSRWLPRPRGDAPEVVNAIGRTSRLPRPRGDAPVLTAALRTGPEAPPPTRGCTRHLSDGPHRSAWLPRPRGDAPLCVAVVGASPKAPPPTRGCTSDRIRTTAERAGSPAHAGMHPGSSRSVTISGWLPRPRGDAPSSAAPAAT